MVITWRAIALMAVGLAFVVFSNNLWAPVWWAAGVVALALLDVWFAVSPKKIQPLRPELPTSRRDEARTVPLQLHNTAGRSVALAVRDAWQPSVGISDSAARHTVNIAAGETVTIESAAAPFRRGHLINDHIAIRSFGPLRLAARQRTLAGVGVLSVLPPFQSRKHLPGLIKRLKWVEGQVATRLRGGGAEFDSLREYVDGDDIRSMDWRATARHQKMIVRTWRPEQDRRILVVIDTSRLSAVRIGDEPRIDALLDTTLLLSSLAASAHDRVDVVALDTDVRAAASGVGRTMTVANLMQVLAPVQANLLELDWERTITEVHRRCKQHALVVVLTAVDGGVLDSAMLHTAGALQRQHGVIVAAVRDQELVDILENPDEDAWTQAAAARELRDGDAVAEHLRRIGVGCVLGTADTLPKAVCDHYLDLKLRGQL